MINFAKIGFLFFRLACLVLAVSYISDVLGYRLGIGIGLLAVFFLPASGLILVKSKTDA